MFVLLSSTRDCGPSSSGVTPADAPWPSRHVFGASCRTWTPRCYLETWTFPATALHPLTGDRRDQWSVRVSGNWRIVFRFMDGVATDVDLIDYH